jgi:hypothetical protein
MRYPLLRVAAALLTIALVACSHATPPPDASAPPAKSTVLRVVNRNFYDFTIYLSRFGERIRLGTATGNRTTMFEFPSQFVQSGTVRFEAHPVGGVGSAFTEELTVHPGDVVGVEITP